MTSLKTVLLGSAAGLLAAGVCAGSRSSGEEGCRGRAVCGGLPRLRQRLLQIAWDRICIRHFGYVKFNCGFQDKREAWDPDGPGALDPIVEKSASNTVGWQWSIRPGWDFRSPTEFGTMRAVVQMRVDMRNGVFENDDPVLTGTMRASTT